MVCDVFHYDLLKFVIVCGFFGDGLVVFKDDMVIVERILYNIDIWFVKVYVVGCGLFVMCCVFD